MYFNDTNIIFVLLTFSIKEVLLISSLTYSKESSCTTLKDIFEPIAGRVSGVFVFLSFQSIINQIFRK